MARLWYWDYSPEVFIRVMDEYAYGILAMKKGGMQLRIKLVSTLFADVMQQNAAEPEKPPLDYNLSLIHISEPTRPY